MRQYDTGDDCMAPDNRGKVMGEMADMAVDAIINGPYGMWCPPNKTYHRKSVVMCNKCKSRDVFWKQLGSGKWCLHDTATSEPHSCRTFSRLPVSSHKKKSPSSYHTVKCCGSCIFLDHEEGYCFENNMKAKVSGLCNEWKGKL